MKRYKIVEVEWEDAQSTLDRWDVEELKKIKPETTFSTGYLLDQNDDRVILGFMMFGETSVKHSQYIPIGMIKNITVLRDIPKSESIDTLRQQL